MDRFEFDSDDLPENDRPLAYEKLFSPAASVRATGSDFRAAFSMVRLDECLIYERYATDIESRRSAEKAAADQFDHIVASVFVSGEFEVATTSGFRSVPQNSMLVVDLGYPLATRASGSKSLTLSIARDRLSAEAIASIGPEGAIIDGHMAAFIRDHLESLLKNAHLWDTRQAQDVSAGTAKLLDAAICDRAIPAGRIMEPPDLISPLREYIEANLSDPNLNVAELISLTQLSRATVYRRFKRYGGLGNYLRMRRLRRLAIELAKSDSTLDRLASDVGFASTAHASRCFFNYYGIRPGDYRLKLRANRGMDIPAAFQNIMLAEVLPHRFGLEDEIAQH